MASKESSNSSVQMMHKLLPILLYIRNYNEYNRHKPSQPSIECNKFSANNCNLKMLRVSQQITAYYEAEARLNARRQARAEARAIRAIELERQQREQNLSNERLSKSLARSKLISGSNSDIPNKSSLMRRKSSCSSYTSSRRSSESSIDLQNSEEKHIITQLYDLDDKYKEVMVNNAQLENEKQSLSYQINIFKDEYEEIEENYIRLNKQYKDKVKSLDQLGRNYKTVQKDCDFYRQCLRQRNYLIEEAGLVFMDSEENNHLCQSRVNHLLSSDLSDTKSESLGDESGSESGISGSVTKTPTNVSLVSREAAQLLAAVDGLSLESKIRTLLSERQLLVDDLDQLKTDLKDERQKAIKYEELTLIQANSQSANYDTNPNIQREANKLVSDYKLKLERFEHEISTLNGTVMRLETQLTRYRNAVEEADRVEEELKAEKRKTNRELKEALARIDELETESAHLQKRIDKLKSNRNING
ncbi:leucine-rich repeat flightless-interacting protein 2-like [Oppia nitens]|uniref:leucine-rich repeat flightless-interacting protein 2-like n=1 Tax=Oppia nitens TaxID=1686743 RepID=UPI0023DBD784|nr:leucine-rich repeat flightless-interacting protein 2-like [Oppia nitens]